MRRSPDGWWVVLLLGTVLVTMVAGCTASPEPAPRPAPASPTSTPPSPARAATSASASLPQPTGSSPAGPASPTHTAKPTPSCADLAAKLTLREQVGQLLMVAVSSGGLGSKETDVLDRTRAGSVILLGNSTAGRAATKRLVVEVRQAAKQPHGVQTLLAADQEGGLVQRLRGPSFSRIPAATEQAQVSDAELARRAATWGRQLRAAGIDANLAPVADVVPSRLGAANEPIGRLHRGYGPSPKTVAAKVAAFIRGMDAAGVATAVKHFPGLGAVRGNTDFVRHVVDRSTTRHGASLAGFAAGVHAGTDMVMVSSAYYAKIDPDHRAAFSHTVIADLLRHDLGFGGVVISDDLSAAAMTDVAPGDRALRFLQAGGDLLIVSSPDQAAAMAKALLRAAEDDPPVAARVTQSATRVLAMKARRHLIDC